VFYQKWKPAFSQRSEGRFLIALALFTLILAIVVQRFTVIYLIIVAILVIRTLFFERNKYLLGLFILGSAVVLMSLRLAPNSVTNQSLRNEAGKTAEWLGKHAEKSSVIGGSTLVTSYILAQYSFPVMNNTFYESTYSQRATADTLRVYSHISAYDYWNLMRTAYRLDYLVLERGLCNSETCNLQRFFKNTSERTLCEELVLKSTPYFELSYYNREFAVLKLLPGFSVTGKR
jgi:membrane protein implicated in regulation of membrane protease activity